MSKNPFGNLNTDGLEQAKDSLGGGRILESDVYDGVIKHVYAGKSGGGAQFIAVRVELKDGNRYDETLYVTSKDGKNYYEKDGKKIPLPGFTTANDLALMSTGIALNEQDFEEKVLSLYDFDAKQEVAKAVPVATEMTGKAITLAILKNIEDKNKKNETTGEYEPTGETRETNTIDKVFHNETGKTVSEYIGKKDAEFQNKWREKNKGRVNDRSKGAAGKSGAPKSGAPSSGSGGSKPKSLFG